MKEVPLTKGYVATIDDEDWELISQHKWYVLLDGQRQYARSKIHHNGQWLTLRMHRLILFGDQWLESALAVDHINGNGLDNRRCNLRPATKSINSQNRGLMKNNTSGYRGVYYCPRRLRKFEAQIRKDNVKHHLGFFSDAEEAARAYDKAALTMYGPRARFNFPDDIVNRTEETQ